ncbi:MAG: signal peptidase I [Armatimonadetes bacterium]|nr:signal peptidase I [Armatimonadota bacterium]
MDVVARLLSRWDLDPVVGLLLLLLLLARLVLFAVGRRTARRAPRPDPAKTSSGGCLEWFDTGLLTIIVAYCVVRPFVAQVVMVQASSMAPTLNGTLTPEIDGPADRLLVSRLIYLMRPPRRGEVVVFRLTEANTLLDHGNVVKRVIAIAGDTVALNDRGRVVLNGRELTEPYARDASDRVVSAQTVPAGSVFVLGDNRRDSRDSSRFERSPFVPLSTLRGKAVAVVWPLGRARLLAGQ